MLQYDVVVSNRAKQMLGVHIRFRANVSVPAAREVKDEIMKQIRPLMTMPERFPFFAADFIPPNKYHKMCINKRYLVLYQIKDKIVYVDYIIDCRQSYSWLLF